jgi:HlyD family secretion protein
MTATADIRVTEIKDALLVPNASLRYAPPAPQTTTNRSILSRLMPRPSQLTTTSPRDATGSDRTIWVLRDGQPAQVKVVVGASDGKRTEVRDGELTASQTVIVDQTTSKP